jgi:hypothetical protein
MFDPCYLSLHCLADFQRGHLPRASQPGCITLAAALAILIITARHFRHSPDR